MHIIELGKQNSKQNRSAQKNKQKHLNPHNYHLCENLPVVDADDGADHLGEDDHVPQVGLHHIRLLVHLRGK